MHIYHYTYDGSLKRQSGRVSSSNALTVILPIQPRDGLYIVMITRRYAKGIPIALGDDFLKVLSQHAFIHHVLKSAHVLALAGDAQSVADQIAGFYFNYSQEEL